MDSFLAVFKCHDSYQKEYNKISTVEWDEASKDVSRCTKMRLILWLDVPYQPFLEFIHLSLLVMHSTHLICSIIFKYPAEW